MNTYPWFKVKKNTGGGISANELSALYYLIGSQPYSAVKAAREARKQNAKNGGLK